MTRNRSKTDFKMVGLAPNIRTGRGALVWLLAVSLLALAADPGVAHPKNYKHHKRHHVSKKHKKKEKIALPKGTLQIVVSLGDQHVTVYSDGVQFARGAVSTGTPGHPTPMGVFTVIGKERFHRSNLYSNAPMPYMQRLTWSGVAMHAGHLPGYPASHGCIRMRNAFARKLWRYTKRGVRVLVARHDVPPHEISHPKLFVPRSKPMAALPVIDKTAATPSPATTVKTAQTIDPNNATDAPGPASKAARKDIRKALRSTISGAAVTLAPGALTLHVNKPSPPVTPSAPGAATTTATTAAHATSLEPATASAAPDASSIPRTAILAATAKPVEQVVTKPTVPYVGLSPADLAELRPPEPKVPKGPVSVFVSRKTSRLYVRKGNIPMFNMPVVIRDPDKPFGTQVFTAIEVTDEGAGMRWTVQTMPAEPERQVKHRRSSRNRSKSEPVKVAMIEPPPPSEVLDRIEMPVYAVNQISKWLSPGSSLIVSDHAMSNETHRKYTDFIIEVRPIVKKAAVQRRHTKRRRRLRRVRRHYRLAPSAPFSLFWDLR